MLRSTNDLMKIYGLIKSVTMHVKTPSTSYGVYTAIQTYTPTLLIKPPHNKDVSIIYRSFYDLSEKEHKKLVKVATKFGYVEV